MSRVYVSFLLSLLVLSAVKAQAVSSEAFFSAIKKSGPVEIELLKKKSGIRDEIEAVIGDAQTVLKISELNTRIERTELAAQSTRSLIASLKKVINEFPVDEAYAEARFIDGLNRLAKFKGVTVLTQLASQNPNEKIKFDVAPDQGESNRIENLFMGKNQLSPFSLICQSREGYYLLATRDLERVKFDHYVLDVEGDPSATAAGNILASEIPTDTSAVAPDRLETIQNAGWYIRFNTFVASNAERMELQQTIKAFSRVYNYRMLNQRLQILTTDLSETRTERTQLTPHSAPAIVLANPEVIRFVKSWNP